MSSIDVPAWIVLLTGVYSMAAAIGEFRSPGMWMKMFNDLADAPGLRFVSGIMLIAMGGAIYLVGPWDSSDWMLVVAKFLGVWMIVEGALFIAFGDAFLNFARRLMGAAEKLWVAIAFLIGVGLTVAAALRF